MEHTDVEMLKLSTGCYTSEVKVREKLKFIINFCLPHCILIILSKSIYKTLGVGAVILSQF